MKELKVFKEFWRTVVINGVEHHRYMVSNFGKVKCLNWKKTGKEKILTFFNRGNGYLCVNIDSKLISIHRIVAEAFIPNNQNKPYIDHINTIKTDNVVILDNDGKTILYTNLLWCTPHENNMNKLSLKNMSRNAGKSCLGKLGAEHHRSISIVQLTLDGKFIKKWGGANEAARELKIHHGDITKCCQGKRKSAGGFKWMYYEDWRKVIKRSISEIKPLF